MTSVFTNPSFYISIFSSICFITSEILPFLPIKANGILHAILVCLSDYNKNNFYILNKDTKSNSSQTEDEIVCNNVI
jgi:hypothetical protein